MQIVIDIPDNYMSLVKSADEIGCAPSYNVMIDICRAVATGTPLPKGHGEIVDIRPLMRGLYAEKCVEKMYYSTSEVYQMIENETTVIIEASEVEE